MDEVRFAPVTFQEFVPADLDLRVIVVEDEVFAAAIRSQPEYRTDYRAGIGSAEFRRTGCRTRGVVGCWTCTSGSVWCTGRPTSGSPRTATTSSSR